MSPSIYSSELLNILIYTLSVPTMIMNHTHKQAIKHAQPIKGVQLKNCNFAMSLSNLRTDWTTGYF